MEEIEDPKDQFAPQEYKRSQILPPRG
jgi:hypothetical protein